MQDATKEYAIGLLRDKYASNPEKYPSRSDFSPYEVGVIKSMLGPWPRALEKAGIKPESAETAQQKLQRRIDKKRRINLQRKKQNPDENSAE